MSSIMEDDSGDLSQRIARRLRNLRAASGWSLEALAGRTGVSRSMLSLIERGESSPTAVVLEKLASGLGVPLASLFDPQPQPANPVSRRADQAQWRDPASGYRRRNVSPAGTGSAIRIVEVEFPPAARVTFEPGPRSPAAHQQVWVLAGTIEVTVGGSVHRLEAGDCLAHRLDDATAFHNPGDVTARYAVVLAAPFLEGS